VDSGFYAACAGLRAQSQALEVSAHNLANLNTPGFRAQDVSFQSLLALVDPAAANELNHAINNYGVLEGTHLDLSAGNVEMTGNPLDLAVEGEGFFAVQTSRGVRYTRGGSFRVSTTGELVTAAGDPVLGQAGTIHVPTGAVSIGSDGTISVAGAIAGSIQLSEFPLGTELQSEGDGLLCAPANRAQPALRTVVRQGALESSNVNAIRAMTELIGVQRHAELLGRALSMFDTEMNHIAANDLPRI